MFPLDWKSYLSGLFIVVILLFLGLLIGKYLVVFGQVVFGQKPNVKSLMGYFVKVEALNVPEDITAVPIGTFILYDKSGTKEIWRENISLGTYESDAQLETAIDNWAVPYISKYERKIALSNLAGNSKIVGVKITHKQ